MKNPHQLSDTWNGSLNKEPVLISVPGTNKKFKRKSREPKKLFSSSESDRMKNYRADMSDDDQADDTEARGFGRLGPLQRQLMMSQESTASATGILSGLSEGSMAPAESGAIDMRIGINVPAITSKLSQLAAPPFSSPEISHWPTAISQPLSNRLKLGIRSTFPLSTSSSSSHSLSPSHQAFSMEPSLSGQAASLSVPRTSHTSQCLDHLELQAQSPQDSPQKRPGTSADGPGRLPEVKAVQQTRRLLANARERTRVHTISAAFEALRKQVPCYSYGQKLSKLAILRIACNYILSLAQLAELDYSSEHGSVSFSQCVEQCTRTLQAEGRSKKRKVGRMPEDV
ncbi:transcription factor atoh8 [Solea solea]|uniref:transcription factor atoh8 n=1 Tax=Solea solea TaxID=90069 RepID=UPI0027299E6C|nr:transcription factor atoh8 [Solea solea]